MPRELDQFTLENYGKEFAYAWSKGFWPGFPERKRHWLGQEFYKFTFMDEFEYLVGAVSRHLRDDDLREFQKTISYLKTNFPRSDNVFGELLATKLAIDKEGEHIVGMIGTTKVGSRIIGKRTNAHGRLVDAVWPLYAGEEIERVLGNPKADPLPDPHKIWNLDEHLRPYVNHRPILEPPPDLSELLMKEEEA
jgi:hypothetical protein